MGAQELLKLIVDADVHGAVSGVQKVGAATEKELGKSSKTIDAWGRGFSKAGVGMLALGGAGIVALGAMAKRSEEANLATVKLQNSLSANPRLAGTSAKSFIDLAQSIQAKTAADGDDIVAGEAVLAQGKLQARQIRELTPLVVDLARKKGIDEVTAFTLASKAVQGNAGALKRAGIAVDETKFKTDAYGATVDALKTSVGGFSEQEGKTFAGSLQRMKNQLGDLEEGVGKGAVDAFTKMFSVVGKTAGALEKVSPGAQHAAGEIATFGAAGLLAIGGLSTLIGQAIKARENFAALGSGVSALSSKLGGLGSIAGPAGIAAAIGALAFEAHHLNDEANKFDAAKIADQLNSMSTASEGAMRSAVKQADAIGALNDWFKKLLDTSVPAAQRFLDLAKSAGVSKDKIAEMSKALADKKDADIGAAKSQNDYSDAVQKGADAMDAQTSSTDKATEALQKYHDKISDLFDPIKGYRDSLKENQSAQADYNTKVMEAIAAQDAYTNAVKKYGPHSKQAAEAAMNYSGAVLAQRDAQDKTIDSALGLDGAMHDLRAEIQRNPKAADAAKAKLAELARQHVITGDQAKAAGRQIDGFVASVNKTPAHKNTAITTSGVNQAKVALASVKDQIYQIPASRTVTIHFAATGAAAVSIAEAKLLGPGHAGGGPTKAGVIYPVGEQGPELFVAATDGFIIPHNKMNSVGAGGGGMGIGDTYNIHVDKIVADDPKRLFAQLQQHMKNTGPLRLKVRGGL